MTGIKFPWVAPRSAGAIIKFDFPECLDRVPGARASRAGKLGRVSPFPKRSASRLLPNPSRPMGLTNSMV